MHASYLKESTCLGCHLTPFCDIQEKPGISSHLDAFPIKHRLVLQKHERLFSANNRFQYLYAIEQGTIKTVQTEADGSELIRGFYFSGETLGYEAIYSGRYHYSAIALAETHVCVLDYRDFLHYLQSNPELQEHVLSLISSQLSTGSYLLSATADRKLACFLLDLSSRLHRSMIRHEFQLPMSRQDIGNYLGLTTETISRACTRLQQNHIVAIKHKKVRFLQPDMLRRLADGLIAIDR